MEKSKIHKLTLLALMIALDVVLSPLMRIEGMAPMSSVMNIIAGVLLGPFYGTVMALVCALIRMTMDSAFSIDGCSIWCIFCWFILSFRRKTDLVNAG